MYLGTPDTNIMLALDTEDRSESFRVMEQCCDLIDVVKFNYPLILKEGLGIMTEIKDKFDLPLVADFKVADVPVTNNKIIKLAMNAGANAILVHGFIGADAIMEMKEIVSDKIGIIIVTELTHPGGLEFTRKHSKEFAELCNFLDCYGIQAPGNRPDQIKVLREIIGPDKVIVSCGLGVQSGKFDEAIEAGADFGIIGRAIYEAKNPREAVKKFLRAKAKVDYKRN